MLEENELYHHGIKGQRWGVRRYQNKDGTLTNEGRKRYSNTTGYDIPKGSIMFRAVRNGSKKFMDRDYAYINVTDEYSEHSIATSSGFDGAFDTDYMLKATKRLKIASTNEYFNAVMKANNINPKQYLSKVPKETINKGKYIVENLLPHSLIEGTGGNYSAFNNAVKYLKDKGYDGVIDPIDGAHSEKHGEKAIATVIFDPKNNVKIVDKY